MFCLKEFHLTTADTVLAGGGAVHSERAANQPIVEILATRDLLLIVDIAKQLHVKIAISHVPDDRPHKPAFRHVALRFDEALREA
jgi:hypothetical protein